MRSIYALSLLLITGNTAAQYRCVENGKTTYTDRPCLADAPSEEQVPPGIQRKIVGDTRNSAYSTPYGSWRGQIQYQATGSQGPDISAMAVVPVSMEIDPQGRVTGSSPENGCRFSGIAAPGLIPTSLQLDLTFSGCKSPVYNHRWFGNIAVNANQKHAQFSLSSHRIKPLASITSLDIKGTLRR